MAAELQSTIAQCGMIRIDVGKTYMADRLRSDGSVIESALDHIYVSQGKNIKITGKTLNNSATDHLPIIAKIGCDVQDKAKSIVVK